MGSLFGSQDSGPSPEQMQQEETARKLGEARSAQDLARIRSQRISTASLLNPGLKIPGQGGSS